MPARDVALRYLEAFSSGDPDAVVRHVSPDFENCQHGVLGKGCRGANIYRQRLSGFLDTFRKLRYEVEDLVAEDNRVAVSYLMHFDYLHDGPRVSIHGAMIITVADGLITKRSDYWDGLDFLQQTGQEIGSMTTP